MAITKIHAIKSTLGKALAYIENPDKTDGQMLVSGYNCEPQTASIDFEMTAVLEHKARNLKRKRSTNLAYHLIQSFSPEDAVTPEQAHELGKAIRLHRGQNAKSAAAENICGCAFCILTTVQTDGFDRCPRFLRRHEVCYMEAYHRSAP